MGRAGLLLLGGVVAVLALSGCGSKGEPTAPQLALERADFLAVSHGLQGMEGRLGQAIRASRTAWPYVFNGLSSEQKHRGGGAVTAAASASSAVEVPTALAEGETQALTGPSSSIGGDFRAFIDLAPRSWTLIGGAIAELDRGGAQVKAYARETVPLYIESVYDGYFILAQIGRKVSEGYAALGGSEGFAGSLSQAEVNALESFYSESTFRLEPHPGVKLGS